MLNSNGDRQAPIFGVPFGQACEVMIWREGQNVSDRGSKTHTSRVRQRGKNHRLVERGRISMRSAILRQDGLAKPRMKAARDLSSTGRL